MPRGDGKTWITDYTFGKPGAKVSDEPDEQQPRKTTVEHIDTTYHVRLLRFSFPEYPYDHFLLVKLPGNRNFLYREESDDYLIWEGEIDHAVGYDRFLFPLIDAVCRDKLCRVDPVAQ